MCDTGRQYHRNETLKQKTTQKDKTKVGADWELGALRRRGTWWRPLTVL